MHFYGLHFVLYFIVKLCMCVKLVNRKIPPHVSRWRSKIDAPHPSRYSSVSYMLEFSLHRFKFKMRVVIINDLVELVTKLTFAKFQIKIKKHTHKISIVLNKIGPETDSCEHVFSHAPLLCD